MSDITESKEVEDILEKIEAEILKPIVEEINEEEKNDDGEREEEKGEEEEGEVKTFIQLFELFLTQDQHNLLKFNIKLTHEEQQYFILLCKESPELFGTFEENLKKIISDDKINTKDIPDILLLVSKVYNIIKTNKGIPIIDPYKLIKSLLHVAFAVYIETNKIENSLLLLDLLNIIDSSIDLIKMTPIVKKNVGCGLFRCK